MRSRSTFMVKTRGLAPTGHSWILRCNREENDFLGFGESVNQPHLLAAERRRTTVADS